MWRVGRALGARVTSSFDGESIESAAFNDEGTAVVSVSGEGDIALWDLTSGRVEDQLTRSNGRIYLTVAWQPGSTLVAVCLLYTSPSPRD